uniref:Uncharacterized protein n=1 Tax=Sphaerodactylus townsendi TaxID=933632 RepID=A0ACB8G462_9SAUR
MPGLGHSGEGEKTMPAGESDGQTISRSINASLRGADGQAKRERVGEVTGKPGYAGSSSHAATSWSNTAGTSWYAVSRASAESTLTLDYCHCQVARPPEAEGLTSFESTA